MASHGAASLEETLSGLGEGLGDFGVQLQKLRTRKGLEQLVIFL